MEVQEASKQVRELETQLASDIQDALSKFQTQTGLSIQGISVYTIKVGRLEDPVDRCMVSRVEVQCML